MVLHAYVIASFENNIYSNIVEHLQFCRTPLQPCYHSPNPAH